MDKPGISKERPTPDYADARCFLWMQGPPPRFPGPEGLRAGPPVPVSKKPAAPIRTRGRGIHENRRRPLPRLSAPRCGPTQLTPPPRKGHDVFSRASAAVPPVAALHGPSALSAFCARRARPPTRGPRPPTAPPEAAPKQEAGRPFFLFSLLRPRTQTWLRPGRTEERNAARRRFQAWDVAGQRECALRFPLARRLHSTTPMDVIADQPPDGAAVLSRQPSPLRRGRQRSGQENRGPEEATEERAPTPQSSAAWSTSLRDALK